MKPWDPLHDTYSRLIVIKQPAANTCSSECKALADAGCKSLPPDCKVLEAREVARSGNMHKHDHHFLAGSSLRLALGCLREKSFKARFDLP